MQYLTAQIHKLLIKNRKTIAVAESCTGGLAAGLLTRLSGSSRYFILGVVAYSNEAKINILHIPKAIIRRKSAISKEVALALAQAVRKLGKTDFGIGITGIAGPTGATAQKPVGTVFIAVNSKNKNLCKKCLFKGGRLKIRKSAALKSLSLLKSLL